MPHSVIRYSPHFNGVRLQNYVAIFSFIADVIPPMSSKAELNAPNRTRSPHKWQTSNTGFANNALTNWLFQTILYGAMTSSVLGYSHWVSTVLSSRILLLLFVCLCTNSNPHWAGLLKKFKPRVASSVFELSHKLENLNGSRWYIYIPGRWNYMGGADYFLM